MWGTSAVVGTTISPTLSATPNALKLRRSDRHPSPLRFFSATRGARRKKAVVLRKPELRVIETVAHRIHLRKQWLRPSTNGMCCDASSRLISARAGPYRLDWLPRVSTMADVFAHLRTNERRWWMRLRTGRFRSMLPWNAPPIAGKNTWVRTDDY